MAHEDHPQRALHAALAMQGELRRYADTSARGRQGFPLEARVGVNTGEVVVRSIETGEAHTEYTPVGHVDESGGADAGGGAGGFDRGQ